MIITIEQQNASCIEESGIEVAFEHSENRSEFLSAFPGADYSTTRQVSYEPDRSLYHIVEADYSIAVLSSPDEDPRMAYIHNNVDAINNWFHQKFDERQASYQSIT